MTTAVPTALRQSSQSVFLSHPDRLSSQVMPVARDTSWNITPLASGSPSTFIVFALLRTGLACFIGIALHRLLPCGLSATEGIDLVSRCVSDAAASDTPGRRSDGHWSRRSSPHSPQSDKTGRRRVSPILRGDVALSGTRTSLPDGRNASNIGTCHAD
jgi:hypothetical protein